MEIEQTEDKDNESKLNVQIRKKIIELEEYLGLKDVNLIYENFVDSESRNSIEKICLNLIDETWTNFEHLKNIFSIENEEEHWVGCCLYLAYEKISYIVRKKIEVENQNNQNQLSNKKNPNDKLDSEIISKIDKFPFFSILKLLRQLKIDLSKFLKLTNKLIEILKVPAHLSTRLIKIESNFNVARVLFEKYETIFKNVFNYSYEFLINFFATDQHTIDTHSKVNSKDFFTFGWLLFINIKNQFPHISNDLVNSYHLLICCINYLYQRIENLNQQYLLRISICRKNGLKSLKFNKFIDYICKKYDGNSIEIKTVNEYYFQPQIKNLLSDKFESMEFLHILCTKLDQNYEKVLLNRNNCANTEQSFNLDIDERALLNKLVHHTEKVAIDQEEKALFSIKVSDSLQTIYDLDSHEHESKSHNYKFEFQKVLDLFKTLFINDVIKNFNESRLDDLAHVKENVIYLLNEFFAIVYNFYLLSIEILISNEKKRLGLDCFLKHKYLKFLKKKLYENETFHKSVYTCCFEILLNSSFVSKSFTGNSAKQQTEKVHFLTLIELKSDQFRFPYSLKNLKLDPVDLLRIIELFITNTSINNQTNSIHLNKPMIRHLNTMEENILELLCWSKESKLWALVKQLKLVCPGPNIQSDLSQLNFPFPLYDEVGFANSPQFSHGTGSSGSFLTAAVLTNPKSESSPAKPTITRVVCSTNSSTTTTVSNDNMILTTKTLPNNSTKQIQVLTLTPTGSRMKNQKHGRLLNMTSFLTYFFRKFYNLANVRLRHLLDKLNMNSLLNEPDCNQANSSQPLTPIACASTPILTPVTSSTLKPTQSVNSEKHQLFLKKIWNIFEFSVSLGADKNSSLIRGRHLDQMLLCAVYLACKLTHLPILFTEILKAYKSMRSDSSSIYRDVLLDQAEYGGDLIQFYNTIYIKCMKEFALKVHAKFSSQIASNPDNKLVATPVNNLHLLSPVPRPAQINLNINLQFTSRKIVDTKSVLISPSKDRLVSSTAQFVQPINNKYSGRNKLAYLFNELGSEKMIFQINEMIRKSEVKIRGSNKRLFSEMSSHCLPISALSAKTSSNSEDERDGRVKLTRIGSFGSGQSGLSHANTMLGHSGPTSSNFLSKIVSSKLGSRSNSNLVTMVVGSSPNQNQSMNLSLPLGANFSRQIQTIQNERTNVN